MNGVRTAALAERPAPAARPAAAPAAAPVAVPAALPVAAPAPVQMPDTGRPLDPAPLALLEHRFGRSLADVRIHTDDRAARMARSADALAYTVGNNIVFGPGAYQPGTPAGLELLAHEVAHTVQQRGAAVGPVQKYATAAPRGALEQQAAAAARTAIHGPPVAGGAARHLTAVANEPTISYLRSWQDLTNPVTTDGQQVTEWEPSPAGPSVAAFKIPVFKLPAGKGPVIGKYQAAVDAKSLEASIGFRGGQANKVGNEAAAALWQSRADTADLRDNWLAKVNWSRAEADTKWNAAGGAPGTAFKDNRNPRLASSPIDMDHIVELQIGGTNVPSNIQPLERSDNQQSGRDIWSWLSGLARPLADRLTGTERTVVLSFQAVSQVPNQIAAPTAAKAPGTADHGWEIDWAAVQGAAAAAAGPGGGTREAYPVVAGAQEATFQVPPGQAPVDLRGDETNLRGAEVVPGLLLERLNRNGTNHQISAHVESANYFKRSKPTRVPITLPGNAAEQTLDAIVEGGRRRLRLHGNQQPRVNFTYPYLSTGWLRLGLDEQGLHGDGELRPSLPLLSQAVIRVHMADGVFDGTLGVDPARIRLPGVPQFRCTRSDISIALAPELRVTGNFGFEVGQFLSGEMRAEPTASGLLATGTIRAHIPHVDRAEGNVQYRDGRLSGEILVHTEQLASLPGRPQGELRVGFDEHGVHPSGTLTLQLPGDQQATLEVRRGDRGLLFTGNATFAVPGLQPVRVSLSYDGEHLGGHGSTGIVYRGLTGTMTVRYHDGHFSGDATATLQRGRVTGTVHLHLSQAGNLYGDGSVRVRITETITGTIGVQKPEEGPLRVTGTLELPPRIVLFQGVDRRSELFNRHVDIPILGFSTPVGSAGLIARITGAFGYYYAVGPGTIDGAQVTAGFNPLEDETDVAVHAEATLNIPARVGFYVSVRGAVGLSAVVGSVTGGLTVDADVGLRGGVSTAFTIDYRQGRFLAGADLRVEGSPVLLVVLTADITAEALDGLWEKRWEWRLAQREWGSAFRLAMVVPIRYASNEPFHFPALSDIRFEGPQFSLDDALPALARMAGV